ncbi:MAG: alpha/beta fold hydrolase, partial [Planctomycetota bacterium]
LVVEKPGVVFLVQPKRPGGAEEGTAEFRREHTLERWVEALNAAVKAAVTLPGIDASRVLALGHSEGGQVVCHLAAANAAVTHVAAMAGGGPTQLFDLIELARSGAMGPPQGTEEERVAWLVEQWKEVLKDSDADGKFFLGHPHRRWTSFLKSSPIEGILKSKARVFIAQGSKDTATLPASTDALYAELLAHGRDVTYERVEGGDHGFMTPGDKGEGWKVTHRKAVEWFLK